ncbi:D-hexose-6-phosphate mutarotase [Streptomyces sp. NPDC002886]|uniref:D-hexose-6-phosphate mutarotase n=1 Tax=Streptomyces sp. NPDC002886 TaxID=3364667 RepID=UPI0036A7FECE
MDQIFEKFRTLPVEEQLSPALTRRRYADFPVLVVDHPRAGQACVSLQGGQLVTWRPAAARSDDPGVLWSADPDLWRRGTAVRGGVPLCWPWFGPSGPAGSPSHGFARTRDWELTAWEDDADRVVVECTLRPSPATRAVWPEEFVLVARYTLTDTCLIEIEDRGDHTATAALHTYVRIGDLGRAHLAGLGPEHTDGLTRRHYEDEDGTLTPVDHVERFQTAPAPVTTVRDEVLGRIVALTHHDHSDVVVWNPGAELARGMADVAPQEHLRFLCAETARVGRPLVAKEGRPGRLAVELRMTEH